VERLNAQDLSVLWLDDVGWPQDIGALAILDGSALILASARLGGEATANRVLAPGLPSRLRR
jgi:diacylglycerol O-acyltransferase / wax synthase